MFFNKNKINIRQLQKQAYKRGMQVQYEKDLQELTKMTARLNNQQLFEIERIKTNANTRIKEIYDNVEHQQKEESIKKLQKYKALVREKEEIISKQANLVHRLRKQNKRLKTALQDTFILRKEITSVLDMQYNYYTTLENSMHTTRQQLTKMMHNMDAGERSIKRRAESLQNFLDELDEEEDINYVELIEKVE